ncbi:hypothetical protein MTO96_008289 [Rhipicephalus appendiculatus]
MLSASASMLQPRHIESSSAGGPTALGHLDRAVATRCPRPPGTHSRERKHSPGSRRGGGGPVDDLKMALPAERCPVARAVVATRLPYGSPPSPFETAYG